MPLGVGRNPVGIHRVEVNRHETVGEDPSAGTALSDSTVIIDRILGLGS